MVSLSVILPVLNEAKNLPRVLAEFPEGLEIGELVLVDGGSTDGSVEIATACCPDIRVVFQEGKGKSDAIRTGVRSATGEYVLIMDADGSHDPHDIISFITTADAGYDLVKGSRYLPGGGSRDESPLRRLLVWVTDSVANVLWGTRYTDIVFGMFIIRRQLFIDLNLTSSGFALETQLMARAKRHRFRVLEIPIYEAPRHHGTSHLSVLRDGWYIGSTVFSEFFHRVTRDFFLPRVGPSAGAGRGLKQ